MNKGTKWEYTNESRFELRALAKDISRAELLIAMYEAFCVDESLYDLKLEAAYVWAGRPMPPLILASDASVTSFMLENSGHSKLRISLCVTPVKRNIVDAALSTTPSRAVSPTPNSQVACLGISVEVNDFQAPCDEEGDEEGKDGDDEEDEDGDDEEDFDASGFYCEDDPVMNDNDIPMSEPVSATPHKKSKLWDAHVSIPDLEENVSTPSSTGSSSDICVGQIFDNKFDLKTKVAMLAMRKSFQYRVFETSRSRWVVKCKAGDCTWKLRGNKLPNSDMFEVSVYVSTHTCSIDAPASGQLQAAPWIVGHVIKHKYSLQSTSYTPRNIIEDVRKEYGINLSYEKAWRCKETAIGYIRGTLDESYKRLPAYFYALEQKNPGSVTDLVLDSGSRFRYCFWALGACIRGFASCRPVICIDGSFLKTKYGGQILSAIALDANDQLFPLAFAVVDTENNHSWTYFLRKLRETIGSPPDLCFISDRYLISKILVLFRQFWNVISEILGFLRSTFRIF